jgi:hypothetical protein
VKKENSKLKFIKYKIKNPCPNLKNYLKKDSLSGVLCERCFNLFNSNKDLKISSI